MTKDIQVLSPRALRRTTAVAPPSGGTSQARKAEQAIAALLEGGTIAQAAKKANMGKRTLEEWLASQWFQTEYRTAKKLLLDGTINHLRSIGLEAVRGLRVVVNDLDSPPSARVSAGRAILEVLLKAVEVQDLEDRIAKLENALAHTEGGL